MDIAPRFVQLHLRSSRSVSIALLAYRWPGSPISLIADHWSQAAVLIPHCIFLPNADEMLADGLQMIVRHGSAFGVRSGGHMPVEGAASTEGVLIAMDNFRDLEYHAEENYASIGPAPVWGEIYSWIDQFGLRVNGGRVYSVGTALLLGGGLGYFSGTTGWAANNVRNFHVVLANGSITDANKDQNADLWWALKGGSGNFAIVTRYDLEVYPVNDIFGGTVLWDAEGYDDYVNAHAAFIAPGGGSEDPKAAIMPNLEVSCLDGTLTAGNTMLYDAPDPNPWALENFTSIPPSSGSLSVQRFANLTQSTKVFSDRTLRQSFHAAALQAVPESIFTANETVLATAMKYLQGKDVSVGAAIQPLTPAHMQAARDRGGDPMDLDPSKGGVTNVLLYARWADETLDEEVRHWGEQAVKELQRRAAGAGTIADFEFLNDAGLYQDPIATYGGGKSREKLREIASRYDPTGVFQQMTGGFKLYTI